jgi:CheY-like chemotaxis protein
VTVSNILLVEDDPTYARFIMGSFRDVNQDFRFFHINSGHAALSILNNGYVPDLIITEDRLPRMVGNELMAAVRANPSLSQVPFITLMPAWIDEPRGETGGSHRFSRPSNYHEALALVEKIRSLRRDDLTSVDVKVPATI